MKFTEPVGTAELPAGPATVAVKVTVCPEVEGFADEATVVVVAAWPTALTTCVRAVDVEPRKLLSPA